MDRLHRGVARRPLEVALLTTWLVLLLAGDSSANGLTPDPTFNGTGAVAINTQAATPIWHFTRVAPNGTIVVVGSVCNVAGCQYGRKLAVARMLASGVIDTTFAPSSLTPGSAVYDIGAVFTATGAAIDSLDRIVVTGRTQADETAVVRILPNGSIDTTFASGGVTPGIFRRSYGNGEAVQALTIDASGRVLLAGYARPSGGGEIVPFVARLTPNGGTDFTFNAGGADPGMIALPQAGFTGAATAIQVDSQSRILIAGLSHSTSATWPTRIMYFYGQPFVARLTAGGVPDAAFNASGPSPGFMTLAGFNDPTTREFLSTVVMRVDALDRAVIAGSVRFLGYGMTAFRILPNGTEDPSAWTYTPAWPKPGDPDRGPVSFVFPIGPGTIPREITEIVIDALGRVFIAGLIGAPNPLNLYAEDSRLFVYRTTANLEPDAGFGPDILGSPPHSPARGFRIYKMTEPGSFKYENLPEGSSLAITTTGLLATSYARLLAADAPVLKLSTNDGAFVGTFGTGGIAFTGQIGDSTIQEGANRRGLSVLTDNSIIVGDSRLLAQYDASNIKALSLSRITAAGVPDVTFNPLGRPPFTENYLPTIDPDAASFLAPPFSASFRDSSGKLLVLTSVQLAGDAGLNVALLRFNVNGSIDTTFNAAGAYPGMNRRFISDSGSSGEQIAQDSLGRYYVVGTAGVAGGFFAFVARFNADGTNDISFNDGINTHVRVYFGTGPDSACSEGDTVRVDANRVWVGGRTRVCPTIANNVQWTYGALARFNLADGTPDATFNAGGSRPGTLVLPIESDRGVARIAELIDDAGGNVLVAHGTTPRAFSPSASDSWDVRVLRILPSGIVDSSYGAGQGYLECLACGSFAIPATIAAAAKAPDGRIYVAAVGAGIGVTSSLTHPPVIMRLDPAGNRDTSFGSNGEFLPPSNLATGYVSQRDIKFDTLGRLVVQGQIQRGPVATAQYELLVQRYVVGGDTQPDPFAFSSVANVLLNSTQTSNPVVVSGIDSAAVVTVVGGSFSIGCTATFSTVASTISNGQSVCVRHTASTGYSTGVTTTLTIGGVQGSFTTTTVSAPPTAVVAVAGNGQASVSFLPPAVGPHPVLGYTVTASPPAGIDSQSGTLATTHLVTGLANGTTYTFTVRANTVAGMSATSSPSNAVTPSAVVVSVTPGLASITSTSNAVPTIVSTLNVVCPASGVLMVTGSGESAAQSTFAGNAFIGVAYSIARNGTATDNGNVVQSSALAQFNGDANRDFLHVQRVDTCSPGSSETYRLTAYATTPQTSTSASFVWNATLSVTGLPVQTAAAAGTTFVASYSNAVPTVVSTLVATCPAAGFLLLSASGESGAKSSSGAPAFIGIAYSIARDATATDNSNVVQSSALARFNGDANRDFLHVQRYDACVPGVSNTYRLTAYATTPQTSVGGGNSFVWNARLTAIPVVAQSSSAMGSTLITSASNALPTVVTSINVICPPSGALLVSASGESGALSTSGVSAFVGLAYSIARNSTASDNGNIVQSSALAGFNGDANRDFLNLQRIDVCTPGVMSAYSLTAYATTPATSTTNSFVWNGRLSAAAFP